MIVPIFLGNRRGMMYYDEDDYENVYNNYYIDNAYNDPLSDNELNQKMSINPNSLEYLISIPQIINFGDFNQDIDREKISLNEFQQMNLDKLKENLVYYFSSPESLAHYKNILEEENKYDFYKDLNSENFISAQKERFNRISSISKSDLVATKKTNKLSDFNDFCLEASIIRDNPEIHKKIINANLIGIEMDECSYIYSQKELDENSLLKYLKELKDIFTNNSIDMESLGLVHFNFIEKNLISILKTIENKLNVKKDKKNLTSFCQICVEIFKNFNSVKLFFYIIQFLNQYNDLLDSSQLNMIKETIQLIPNNCFDFSELERDISKTLIPDLRIPLINQGITEIQLNLKNYITLSYDDYLLLFIGSQNVSKDNSKNDYYFYYKINLANNNIIDIRSISLFNEEDKKNDNIIILDINISIKKEFIYIFYIVENSSKYFLKFKLFNKHSMVLEKENEIEFKNSFVPKSLFNDSNYLYCISYTNEILMIKRNKKLDNKKYINCSFRLFENDLMYYTEIKDLVSYEMFNSLYVNNIFFLNNINDKKTLIAKLIINRNDNYILNIYEMNEKSQNIDNIKIAYNESRFLITKINEMSGKVFYNITSKDFNNLFDRGISLLPFHTNTSNYNYSDDLYEYLIQEYSSLLNLCGNFELINREKEKNLIMYPFSLCCNFDRNLLHFIIEQIIEKNDNYNIKMNFIIILKQIICFLCDKKILKEEVISVKIIPYFKKLIFRLIESKETKLLNKILNEIIEISSYLENNTIFEIDEIKFVLDKDYNKINIKSKFLLIELLLKQNNMKNPKELYQYIINLEKNYLTDILQTENFDLSKYHLCKKLMINVSESFFKSFKIIENDLISLIPCLLDNIYILFELYQKRMNKDNNLLDKYYFLYNSFTFRSFFFLIEYLMANKIILRKKEYIISIYKMILMLDKNNIKSNLYLDMNNIIEIKNYLVNNDESRANIHYYSMNDSFKVVIRMKEKQNIVFKTNLLNITDYQDLYNKIKINLKTSNNGIIKVKLFNDEDYIYHDISEIIIEFITKNINAINNDFIINIIPVKNEKLFNTYKINKDFKIISLIEKSLIHYLLFLFEDIKTQIEKYNNDSIIKSQRKIFQTEIFRFISIPVNKIKKNNFISTSKFADITNKVLEKLNETIDNIEDLDILNHELVSNFNKINKENSQNIFDFQKAYDEKMKQISSNIGQYSVNLHDIKNYEKLFKIFNYDLSNKNNILIQMNKNDDLNQLISKIFLFGIKYYNSFENLNSLMKKLEKYDINDIGDIKNNIEQIRKVENYLLFYSFYEESFKIKSIYHEHKKEFNDLNYDEENKKLYNNFLEKIEFLYNNIIPNDDLTIKPNISIIKNLIELIDNSNLGIYDIIQYSRLQNINSQIKIIELNIINNLLLYLTNEENILLLLNFLNKKWRKSHSILNSIFDNTYGTDYFNMEKLKQQFHLFLNILSNKIANTQNNYSLNTKISLIESLIWRIKKHNFPILLEIMKVFEEIKTEKQNNNNKFLFNFKSDNIYNVNYFNEKKIVNCKFEVFTIIAYQIINIIKDILKFTKEKENKLSLERNPSNISQIDFEKIFEKIISYFMDIIPDCIYYDDLILFFYKILVNSEILLNYIFRTCPTVITRIINISFDNTKIIKENTRLIMIKLLCLIIENITGDNLDDLSLILQNRNNKNIINSNPLIFLYEYIMNELNDDSKKMEIIIKKYYINLLLIIINKIIELKLDKDDIVIKNIFNNKNIFNEILFSENFVYVSENNFIIHSNDSNEVKKEVLFNFITNKSIKKGKIICFLDDNFKNDINHDYNSINRYYGNNNNSLNIFFDKSSYCYSSSNDYNKYKNAFVIMNDFEQLDFYNISNTEIKSISEFEIINSESEYKKTFFRNNSKLLIKFITEELTKDNLNEKGMYLILKILSKLIKYTTKDDLIVIFEIIWKFYNTNKLEENDYPFMSLEYIEKNINKLFQFNKIRNIYKEKEENTESVYSLFDFTIKDNILEINRDLEYINKQLKIHLSNPIYIDDIDESNDSIKKIYAETFELSNLSFIITDETYEYKIIKDNSILFIKSIEDLSEMATILETNINKIKVIILCDIGDNINKNDLSKFINENKIPIYKIEKNTFKKLIDFFIKGNAVKYIHFYKGERDSINIFEIFKFKLDKKEVQEINPMEEIIWKMDKNKLNKIKDINDKYKTKMCRNYSKNGECPYGGKCIYAHGTNELLEVQKIREYLKNKDEKQDKMSKYDINLNQLIKELKEETKNLFNILNIKLSKRIIYDILCQECIKLSELDKIYKDIKDVSYIFEVLCLEFYFNYANNTSSEILREKLINYINKLSNENEISNNKWILYFFEIIEKLNYEDLKNNFFNLEDFEIIKLNNEKNLLEKSYLYTNVLYDKLLYLLNIIDKKQNNEYFIKYYFNIINLILPKLTNQIQVINYQREESEQSLDSLLLSKTINILHNYYINKMTSNQNNNEIFKNINIPNSIDENLKKLISINLDDYFSNNNSLRENYYIMRNNSKKIMSKKLASMIEFIYKYFDICLILLFKRNQTKFFDYMINKKNSLFKHYCHYKILTTQNKNIKNDYKEEISFIYYIKDIISSNNKEITKNFDSNFRMNVNHINEFKINNKPELYDIILKNEKNDFYDYNKLVICCLDDKTKKYYFQDIIDLNELSFHNNSYNLRLNNNIYLTPLKNVKTYLYSFENSTKSLTQENGIENVELTKYENLPKYCWNIGFNGNKYLLLSEEDNQVYNIIEQKNTNKTINLECNINKNIQTINKNDCKITGFINGTGNISSFAYNKKKEFFILDEERNKYKWLTGKEKERIDSPISIQNVKIINICANYKECYAIGNNGNLYKNNGQNFKKISPPEDTKKFLQCFCGNTYTLFLVKNKNNKGVIYSKRNYNNPFLRNEESLIRAFPNEDLDFRYISTYDEFCVGLTSSGKLYVWGLYDENIMIPTPIIINKEKCDSIIVDKIFLNYNKLYAIGRKLENGNYTCKLFLLDKSVPFSEENPLMLKEINITNPEDNNSRIIPIKILIGQNKTYFLCIDENQLINEIIKNNEKKYNYNEITLTINYKSIESKKVEHSLEKFKNIYNSDNINKFIDLYNSLSDKNLKNLIKVFDRLKNEDISILDIDYNELISYLKEKNELNELLSFFLNNENNESKSLFTYLKIRLDLIEKNMMNYIQLNNSLKSEGLFQNIIEQNINYLNDDLRLQYFYSLLDTIRDMNNYGYDYNRPNRYRMYEIKIDRIKANNFKDNYNETKIPDIQLNETIFGQLFQFFKDTKGKEFLRDKGKNLFRVNLGSEDAIDAGGPYREILSDICNELHSDYIKLLIKTPNNKNDIGELRDKYIINPNCDNINDEKAFEFIGKLMALAISSEETLNFNLHPIIWKSLLENQITFQDYETIDLNYFNLIKNLENGLSKKDKNLIDSYDLNYVIQNSNGKDIELIKNGQEIKVTLENVGKYIELAKSMRIEEMKNQIKFIKDGLYSAIGKNILQIINWNQFEDMVCGKAQFDIEDFINHTTCDHKEKVIQWFWDWLKNCKEEDKFKYLKFVSGRSRLPKLNYTHSITVINFKDKNQLPVAHTCSSALDLPNYESKKILCEKMQYAIENIGNITDS